MKELGIKMKKEYFSPILNMIAMLFIILSRLISDNNFDWLALVALIIFLLSAGSLVSLIKKSNNLK
ncbi:MAG: hypothetical protein ACI9OE_002451 [Mariniflexile sp.]